MAEWRELRESFREALVGAFNQETLRMALMDCCGRRLDNITTTTAGFDSIVEAVIRDAEQNHWLVKLAQGVLAKKERNPDLQKLVPQILAGIEAGGPSFYRGLLLDDKVGIEEEAVLLRRFFPYLEWMARRSAKLPLAPIDPSGRDSDLI